MYMYVLTLYVFMISMASASIGTSSNPIVLHDDSNSDSGSIHDVDSNAMCVDMASPMTSRATSTTISPESAGTTNYVLLPGLVFHWHKSW